MLFKPADVLVNEINLQCVKTRKTRRGIVDSDVHCFAWGDGRGKPGLAMKLADKRAFIIKNSDGGHHDSSANCLPRKPECVSGILNGEWNRQGCAGCDLFRQG